MSEDKAIIWFDIDNTLYNRSTRIADEMAERIFKYIVSLGLEEEEARRLHKKYYTEYGLAIRGLSRHHQIDPLDFDQKCDGSLPLEKLLRPDPSVRQLLQDIDRSKFRVWALTNAYINHAKRVLRILNLEDQFEGVVFCDYSIPDFNCKPEAAFYELALKEVNHVDPSKCYFIDDSRANLQAAKVLGWGSCVLFDENASKEGQLPRRERPGVDATISTLEELRQVWPEIFKQDDAKPS